MTTCAVCGRPTEVDLIVAVRGLSDVKGIAYVCRDCLDDVLRRGRLHPKAKVSVGDRMGELFLPDRQG
jgi:hypothetical protein